MVAVWVDQQMVTDSMTYIQAWHFKIRKRHIISHYSQCLVMTYTTVANQQPRYHGNRKCNYHFDKLTLRKKNFTTAHKHPIEL